MSVMSGSKLFEVVGDEGEKMHEIIHSGHFMVSEFQAEDEDDEDEVAVPVREEDLAPRPLPQHLSIETSLTKLFDCMTLAYRQKLTSPKWNMFKGLRLRWKDKIRLNNVIWRCWHIQFVNRKRTLVCQFASPTEIHTHNKPEAIVMEGKYWKRRIQTVKAEYKKWRMFYRNRLLGRNNNHDMLLGLEGIDWQSCGSVKENRMLVDDDYMDFVSDTLLATITAHQPFPFPDSREIARGAGLADLIQPSLVQLQPNLDEFMELEPFQDISSELKLSEILSGDLAIKPPVHYFGGEPSNWVQGDYCRGTGLGGGGGGGFLARQIIGGASGGTHSQTSSVADPIPPMPVENPSPPLLINSTVDPHPLTQPQIVELGGGVPSLPVRGPVAQPQALPEPSYRHSLMTDLTVRRPPITTTTNTLFYHKRPASVMPMRGATELQAAPLLSHMLTGVGYQFSKSEEKVSGGQEVSYLLQGSVEQEMGLRQSHQTPFLFTTSSSSKDVNRTGTQPSPNDMGVIPGSQANQTILPDIQPGHSMGMVSASGTTSPESPVNSEPLSPVNLGSPLSSPSPSKPLSHLYKDSRRSGHINAEQMRRCNIKNGFDTLHAMLPQVSQSPNAKVSKAVLLQKGAEYIRQLKTERSQLQQEIEVLRQQVDSLNSAISSCQEKLPATGAPVSRQKSGKMMDMFRQFVRIRTLDNWKFWILSLMCEPLLISFADGVSTSSPDELYNTALQWLDQHCTLVQLRPIVLKALRKLCTVTEVLADPLQLPLEARNAVEQQPENRSRRS